ncbi:GlxA family transcriptional regulator [Sphingopyxis sp. L1A2A]|uniref:GlxA family transcriptional regulator n=1 Tax=Sphingopyxis sp. L1A2A TaxID=2502247 RepID=UPI00201631CC|nr:GlxA family transcriptional regulator [Sphingopyxis sp. L1A2A]
MTTRLGFLLIDGFALMSYAPVIEPFRAANRLSGETHYSWRHYSVDGAPALASTGTPLAVDGPVDAIEDTDMLFVCAGGNPALFDDANTFAQLRRASRFGVQLAGVSGGPFILAKSGLLDGYRCTVHWEHEAAFLETFTAPRLERGLFVIDRDRITCAGGLAGLDLAVALISQELGAGLARRVSDWYIQSEQREGGGAQRASPGQRYRVSSSALARALAEMEDNLGEPVDRRALAAAANISVRQLERLFSAQLGTTIAAHDLALRLERSRRLLVETTMAITDVATASGFASASHYSREFKRRYSTPPSSARVRSIAKSIAHADQ